MPPSGPSVVHPSLQEDFGAKWNLWPAGWAISRVLAPIWLRGGGC